MDSPETRATIRLVENTAVPIDHPEGLDAVESEPCRRKGLSFVLCNARSSD